MWDGIGWDWMGWDCTPSFEQFRHALHDHVHFFFGLVHVLVQVVQHLVLHVELHVNRGGHYLQPRYTLAQHPQVRVLLLNQLRVVVVFFVVL